MSNRQSAPLDQFLKAVTPQKPLQNGRQSQFGGFQRKGTMNNRMSGGLGSSQRKMAGIDDDDDMLSEFKPPANDFFHNRAARLSCWSKTDADDLENLQAQIIDGDSSDQSADVSIRRLSDADSFAGKSQRSASNSIAGMSRGSFSSQGSKGIRNFLGSKFKKRSESIKKVDSKPASSSLAQSQKLGKVTAQRTSAFAVPGMNHIMGTKTTELPKGEIIMEDIDSDLERSNDSALNYNYDVINLKESETNPYFTAVRDILEYHNRQHNDLNDSDEYDATKAIKSLQTLAIDVKIYMNMAEPQDAIFAIVSDLIVVLFKSKKTIVVMPFKI